MHSELLQPIGKNVTPINSFNDFITGVGSSDHFNNQYVKENASNIISLFSNFNQFIEYANIDSSGALILINTESEKINALFDTKEKINCLRDQHSGLATQLTIYKERLSEVKALKDSLKHNQQKLTVAFNQAKESILKSTTQAIESNTPLQERLLSSSCEDEAPRAFNHHQSPPHHTFPQTSFFINEDSNEPSAAQNTPSPPFNNDGKKLLLAGSLLMLAGVAVFGLALLVIDSVLLLLAGVAIGFVGLSCVAAAPSITVNP